MPLLNFSQPALDATTLAAATDTMKTGWIASGPRVLEFERALSATFGGRPTRTLTSAHGRDGTGAAGMRHWPWRRGDHVHAKLLLDDEHDLDILPRLKAGDSYGAQGRH
jgi:hypothetical protein